MTDRNLRVVVAGLVAMLVVVIGATVLLLGDRNGEPAASPTAPAASGSFAASGSPGASPSLASSSSPTPATLPTPSASSSAGASSSPLPAPLATLTFLGLKLDATDDPGAQAHSITFRSDGPGTIRAKLASTTPQGTTHMCLRVGAKVLGCNDLASGTFTGKTAMAHANWQVTLEGTGAAAPVVNLTVTFQAVAPSVKIEHARFDGTAFADTNGIQARFTPRAAGDAHLVADWGGHPFLYEIDLFDETSGTGDATFPNQGPSTNVDQTFPITAGAWRIVLQNTEAGMGTTDLTATISWP